MGPCAGGRTAKAGRGQKTPQSGKGGNRGHLFDKHTKKEQTRGDPRIYEPADGKGRGFTTVERRHREKN